MGIKTTELANHIFKITGIEDCFRSIAQQCLYIDLGYIESLDDKHFELYNKEGCSTFLTNQFIAGKYAVLNEKQIKNCKKFFKGGLKSKVFFSFLSPDDLILKFHMCIESPIDKEQIIDLYVEVTTVPGLEPHSIVARSAEFDGIDDEIGKALTWLYLNE